MFSLQLNICTSFFFFLNRIRLYESLKDRSYFLPKFAAVAQQELSCKACWERQQPKMQEGTGRGMGVIVLGGLAPDGLSIEQQACPRSPGNSRLAAVPRIWFDGRPRLWEAVSIASVSDGWVARNSRLPPPNSILLQTNTGFYWKETTKGEAVPQPPEEPESVTSKLAGLDLSLSAWCLCFSCSRWHGCFLAACRSPRHQIPPVPSHTHGSLSDWFGAGHVFYSWSNSLIMGYCRLGRNL